MQVGCLLYMYTPQLLRVLIITVLTLLLHLSITFKCNMKPFNHRIQFWHATFPEGQVKLPKESLPLSLSLLSLCHDCPMHLCKETVENVPKVKGGLYFSRVFSFILFFYLICHVDRHSDCNNALESVSQPGNHSLWAASNTEDALADTQCEPSCPLQPVNLWCILLCSYNLSNSNHCTMSRR